MFHLHMDFAFLGSSSLNFFPQTCLFFTRILLHGFFTFITEFLPCKVPLLREFVSVKRWPSMCIIPLEFLSPGIYFPRKFFLWHLPYPNLKFSTWILDLKCRDSSTQVSSTLKICRCRMSPLDVSFSRWISLT